MLSLKKITTAVCTAGVLAATVLFSGCNLSAIFWEPSETLPTSDYQSETEINADTLMAVREKIRAFNVTVETTLYRTMGGVPVQNVGESVGSGVIFDEDDSYYYALTNYHVITATYNNKTYTPSYTVTDVNGTEYDADYVLGSEAEDIAVISFTKSSAVADPDSASSVALGKADYSARADNNVCKNEFVLAVGNPSGVANVVTYGLIVGWTYIQNVSYAVINHSALINAGNSGGALCDIDGNLLGLNTWGSTGSDSDNFSIPLSKINQYIEKFYDIYNAADAA